MLCVICTSRDFLELGTRELRLCFYATLYMYVCFRIYTFYRPTELKGDAP